MSAVPIPHTTTASAARQESEESTVAERMDWVTSGSAGESGSSVCSSSVCTASSSSSSETGAFKATEIWQGLVVGFREGMPKHRRRVKMRQHEECFTGGEAVQWLHGYLRESGSFGTVSKQQAVKLLQKFQQSDVIKEVRGKQQEFSQDNSCRYSFVTEPGPFNFVEETSACVSSLGKRERSTSCKVRGERQPREGEEEEEGCGGAFFTNPHALTKVQEEVASERERKGVRRKSARLALVDANSGTTKPSPPQVADIWKELTLARLLRLVEMPSLDVVLSHDAVDGKHIVQNVLGIVPRLFRSSHGQRRSHPNRPQIQASRGQEAVEDFPGWVITMMNCLSKWPEGCPTDVTTGQPQTFGLETEVLQSLTQYLQALPEPLICRNLYSLHMAVYSLLREGKPSAADALQLCSLLLPQTNRTRVHRLLRTINKASSNTRLHLSTTQSNHDVLVSTLALVVLRPGSSLECTEQDQTYIRNLVWFMSQHYTHVFKVPDELKQQVDKRIKAISIGKDCSTIGDDKTFCRRVTQMEYEAQAKAVSQRAISTLLDRIASDENMTDKERKQKLKLFQQQYPEIYSSKFGSPPSSPRLSLSLSRSWQFHSLRKRNQPILR